MATAPHSPVSASITQDLAPDKSAIDDQPVVEHDLNLSFEELFRGCNKKLTVQIRDPFDGASKNEVISIKIKPGMTPGMRIPFPQLASSEQIANTFLVVKDKANQRFKRLNDTDIEFTAYITSDEQANGAEMIVPTPERDPITLCYEGEIETLEEVFFGRGLPTFGNKKKRGKLVVRFFVSEDAKMKNQQIYQQSGKDETKVTLSAKLIRSPDVKRDCSKTEKEIKDPPITHDLKVSLKQILTGCTRRVKINRLIINQSGNEEEKVEIIPIIIKPGAKEGTTFTFPRYGDQTAGHIPADIIFKLSYKPHERFHLSGYDLAYEMKVLKSQVTKKERLTVPTLKDGPKEISLENCIEKYTRKMIPGQGLPIAENSSERGDLIVHIDIVDDSTADPEAYSEVSLPDPIKPQNVPELPIQDPDIVIDLPLSLEDILEGYQGRIPFDRHTYDKNGLTIACQTVDLPITIPPGARLDTSTTFPNCGHIKPGTLPADVVITISEIAHKTFRRNGADLECSVKISRKQAKHGGKVIVPTLRGYNIQVNLSPPIGPNTIQRIADSGLPRAEMPSKRGDLVLHFEIAHEKGYFAKVADKVVDFISKCAD